MAGVPRRSYSEHQVSSSFVPQRSDLQGCEEEMNPSKRGGPEHEPGLPLAGYPLEPGHTYHPQTPHFHLSFVFIFPVCLKHRMIQKFRDITYCLIIVECMCVICVFLQWF